jgi:hypothetical protein
VRGLSPRIETPHPSRSCRCAAEQATSLRDVELPLLLPGITVSTGPNDYLPFQQLQLRRFNGKNWVGFGDLIDDRQD